MEYIEITYLRWIDMCRGLGLRNGLEMQEELTLINEETDRKIGFFTAQGESEAMIHAMIMKNELIIGTAK
jgi:hypothetical protein